MTSLRVVHVSDLHLGFAGPPGLSECGGDNDGRPLREVDIERAARWLAGAVLGAEPAVDLVLIAGDLFHRANPLPRAVAAAAALARTLIEAGIDVIVIEGNHDAPASILHGSPLAYLRSLGVHVAYGEQPAHFGADAWHNPRLRGHVSVHAVPHGALRCTALDSVWPANGVHNLLVAHGQVEGDARLEEGRAAGRIPAELLRRAWTYVALGDAHAHGHQPLADVQAYYAGSLEALTFGEGRRHPPLADDPFALQGALDIRLGSAGVEAVSTFRHTGARPVLRLTPIRAGGRTAPEVLALIEAAAVGLPMDALVQLDILDCPASLYERLDHGALRRLAQEVRHLDLRWQLYDNEVLQSEVPPGADSLPDQWLDFLADHAEDVSEPAEMVWLRTAGLQRLAEARAALALTEVD